MSKITLLQEPCWLVRSKTLTGSIVFHVVANQWNRSPAHATIYRSEDDARRLVDDMRYHDRVGFGPKDIVEVVPMHGALLTVGQHIQVGRGPSPDTMGANRG